MIEEIVLWIKEKVKEKGMKGVAVSVSGGIDSSVVCYLAGKAFPDNSLGVWIDIESSKKFHENAKKVLNDSNVTQKFYLNLNKTYKQKILDIEKFGFSFNKEDKIIKGNIKARLRMNAIYAFAQKNNFLVLGTSNFSEIFLGYFTKWGDGVADIFPIARFFKSEIISLAKELNIPKEIINEKPSADLWEGQTDEEQFKFTYDDLENYFKNKTKLDYKKIKLIENLRNKNKHKIFEIEKF